MGNKEITFYELMGLIKDSQAPKKIKYENEIYIWYCCSYISENKKHYLLSKFFVKSDSNIPNLKVEILPEENDEWKDIEKIKELQFGGDCKYRFISENGTEYEFPREIVDKINCIIKNQKYLKERLEEKNE